MENLSKGSAEHGQVTSCMQIFASAGCLNKDNPLGAGRNFAATSGNEGNT